jgi:hypothetical protein
MEGLGGAPSGALGRGSRALRIARAHPVLFVLVLSPVIPELLSGSTPLGLLIVSPPAFVGLLVLEMGFYGSGVLLVREAAVRWRKGWTGTILLAAAFGVCEEGFTTILLPHVMGVLVAPTFYGQWLGVNWIWAAVILQLHTTYSIAVQVLLLGLILPETRGRSLLSGRGIAFALAGMLACEGTIVEALTPGWIPPFPLLLLPLALLVAVILLARWLPAHLCQPFDERPTWSSRRIGLLGFLYAPGIVLVEGVTIGFHLPAALGALGMLAVGAVVLPLFLAHVGRTGNREHLVALAGGMLLVDMVWGLLTNLPVLPLAIALDGGVLFVIYRLWRSARTAGAAPLTGLGPSASSAAARPGG